MNRIRFTVAEGRDVPPVGMTVSVPIDGEWFDLGVIDQARVNGDGSISLLMRVEESLEWDVEESG